MTALSALPAWRALTAYHAKIKGLHLRKLFADDPDHAVRFAVEGAGLFLNYSKDSITDETIDLLLQLGEERGVTQRRDAVFAGTIINTTERHAVLHVALRAPRGAHIETNGIDIISGIYNVPNAMGRFAMRLQNSSLPAIPGGASATS